MAAPDFAKESSKWFTYADADRDGAIAGAEAVAFFQRSGLDTATLGQIWELASGGAPKLNQVQFGNALRLVSLSQQHGGRLPLDVARVTLAGLGPQLALPRMRGMQQFGGPSYSPQTTGGAMPGAPGLPGYAPQATGSAPVAAANAAFAAAGYAPQVTGQAGGMGAGTYAPQFTGAGYTPQMTGAGTWPPATAADMARYGAAFQQLDQDRDGLVQGADCFGFFMQWGLDKNVLRHIWELVAGNSGSLNGAQLTSALYLMDCAKRGLRPPPTLPPGPFPPVAQGWSLQSQFGGASGMAAPPVSQSVMQLPAVPQLPTRFVEGAGNMAAPPSELPPSQVPTVPAATLNSFADFERTRLSREAAEAAEKEAKLQNVEEQAARAKARAGAFNAALQEVTVFKSRCEVALLAAQDQAQRLEGEVEATKKKYELAYAAAQQQGDAARAAREQLGALMTTKAEAEAKLAALEAEVAAAAAVTPADIQRMEAEVAALTQKVAAREAAHASATSRLASLREQRAALEERRKAADVDSVEAALRQEVAALAADTAAARASGPGATLGPLLSRAAATYRSVHAALVAAGGEVPFDALPSALGITTWLDDALAGAAEWDESDVDLRGYVLINALPGQQVGVLAKGSAAAPPAAQPAAAPTAALPADEFGEVPAFGAPAAAPAAAVVSAGGSSSAAPAPASQSEPAATGAAAAGFGDDAFGESPAFGGVATAPAPAVAAAPAPAAAAATAPTAEGFGGDAFGEAPAFGASDGGAAPASAAPATPSAPAAAAAAPAAGESGFDDNAFA